MEAAPMHSKKNALRMPNNAMNMATSRKPKCPENAQTVLYIHQCADRQNTNVQGSRLFLIFEYI